jgi:hypothetical protein
MRQNPYILPNIQETTVQSTVLAAGRPLPPACQISCANPDFQAGDIRHDGRESAIGKAETPDFSSDPIAAQSFSAQDIAPDQ